MTISKWGKIFLICTMAESIGLLIKNILLEKKIVFRRFGEHMGMSERSLNYFFQKKDISFSQVIRASEYLGIDLTEYYIPVELRKKDTDTFKILIEICGGLDKKEAFPDFIEKLKQFGRENGYEIS